MKKNWNVIKLITYLIFMTSLNTTKTEKEPYGEEPVDWPSIIPKYCVGHLQYRRPSEAIKVKVTLMIISVYDILEDKMEFGLQITLMEQWQDPSLNVSKLNRREILPEEVAKCLWKPDTIFYNAKQTEMFKYTLPNTYMKLRQDGINQRVTRYRLTVGCSMQFHLYPMDLQLCYLEIALLASTTKEVDLQWHARPENPYGVYVDQNMTKPLSFVIQFLYSNSTVLKWGSSKRPVLTARFAFVRSLMASIVNTYIPSFIVVSVSMVSFWLDVNAVPGRVTLGVTAILTLATATVQVRASLPTLDYMTAMDVWLLGCMITVFLSLIEFTLAQALARSVSQLQIETFTTRSKDDTISWTAPETRTYSSKKKIRQRSETLKAIKKYFRNFTEKKNSNFKKDNSLDRASRICFPFTFITFTIIYWIYFYTQAYIVCSL